MSEQFGRDVADSNARFVALDKRIEETTNRQLQPIVEELEVLGSLVGQLSDAAAETEQRLNELGASAARPAAAARVEVVVESSMNGKEALGRSGRSKALHLPFTKSDRDV